MLVLGLNHGEINASAAIVRDGRLVAGAPEERFNREQRTRVFPKQAVQYCLRATNASIDELDCIAQGWNPGAAWRRFEPLLSSMRLRREDYFYTIPDNLWSLTDRTPDDWVVMDFPGNSRIPPIYYVQHHRAHAANGFFLSPFEEAAILTCDWRGEFECLTWAQGRDNAIDVLHKHHMPHSLGMFYATFTELLGYHRDSDEWKVMALAAFDVECGSQIKAIRGTVKLLDNGMYELDQTCYQGAILEQPKLYTERLVEMLGGREGKTEEEPQDWHYAVARAMQTVAEEVTFHNLRHLHDRTQSPNLAISGGFAMNSVLVGKIPDNTPFKNVYVSFAPADVGNSIGSALYVAHCIKGEPRLRHETLSYLGPEFGDREIIDALNRRGIRYSTDDQVAKRIARLLTDGEIVAYFNGPMEFGERALGNRSILADPRKTAMKEKINAVIKYREGYRPFAPAVLHEKAHLYFDVPKGYECRFMERVVRVHREKRMLLSAVTHVDGSARAQTVRREHNPAFYSIIEEFEKIAGIPVVLNTSFNVNGEPIVLTPDDALNTFFRSGLRWLVMGSCIVQK